MSKNGLEMAVKVFGIASVITINLAIAYIVKMAFIG